MKNPNQFKDTPAVHRGFKVIVVVSGVLLTISLLLLWTNRHHTVGDRQPEVSAAAPAENAWGVVPGTGDKPAPAVVTQITNPVVEVALAETSGVVHDVGASFKMMPASKVQPVVVPESSVRKSR